MELHPTLRGPHPPMLPQWKKTLQFQHLLWYHTNNVRMEWREKADNVSDGDSLLTGSSDKFDWDEEARPRFAAAMVAKPNVVERRTRSAA